MSSYPFIDVHHHIVPRPVARKMKELNMAPFGPMAQWSPAFSLEKMDLAGIAASVLSAPAAPAFVPPEESRVLVRETNEYFAELARSYPGRFGAFATLPMPDVAASAEEAIYALDVLKLDGVAFQSSHDGKYLADPAFAELLAELDRRGAITFIHPILIREHIAGLSPALLEGTFDSTRNVTAMAANRIFDKYPNIRFIIPHTGGMVPYIMWRIALAAMAADAGAPDRFLAVEPSEADFAKEFAILERLYYDTAVNVGPLPKLMKPSQILFGTDVPFPSDTLVRHQKEGVLKLEAEGEEDTARAIAYGNALRLFPRFAGYPERMKNL